MAPTNTLLSEVPEATGEKNESERELAPSRNGGNGIEDQLKKLTQNVKPVSAVCSSSPTLEQGQEAVDEPPEKNPEADTEEPCDNTLQTSPVSQRKLTTTPTKKLSESSGSDQLRKLMRSSPIPSKTDPSTTSGSVSPEDPQLDTTDGPSTSLPAEPLKTADVQVC